MAIAFMDRQVISRKSGHSTVAKAAYNACAKIGNEDYRKKSGLAYSRIITADATPPPDRAAFWQSVEAQEKRKDAQVGYSYTAALPLELDHAQRVRLAENYALKIAARYDLEAVDLTIHYPTKRKPRAQKNKENPHIHLLTPTRTRDGKKLRLFGNLDDLQFCRQLWENEVNNALNEAGIDIKISMKKAENNIKNINEEIKNLEEKENLLQQQLTQIREEIENERTETATTWNTIKRTDELHRRENREEQRGYRENKKRLEESGEGYRKGIRYNRPGTGQATSTTRNGRIPSAERNLGKAGNNRESNLLFTNKAKGIAKRIEKLRLQRTADFIKHKITHMGITIAKRLEALRYERTAKHHRTKSEQHHNQ